MAEMETDYLIVGVGAVGLALGDTLLAEVPDCTVVLKSVHGNDRFVVYVV